MHQHGRVVVRTESSAFFGLLLILICCPAMAVVPYTGQAYDPNPVERKGEIQCFSPQSDDFLFKDVDEIRIDVKAAKRAIRADWQLCRDQLITPLQSGSSEPETGNRFVVRIATKTLAPGFYSLNLTLVITDKQSISDRTVFGWRIADIPRVDYRPADFDQFWQRGLQRLTGIKPDVRVTPVRVFDSAGVNRHNMAAASLPEHSDPQGERYDQVELFKVDFASAAGERIYGWYAKPVGKGPFPCLLILPGAGYRWRPAPLEQARHGFATLDINVFGQPVDWDNAWYTPPTTAPADFPYPMYLHAFRAVDVLSQLPDADSSRLFVAGSSQGGRLTLAVTALHPGIKAGIACIPHFAYLPYKPWINGRNAAHDAAPAGPAAADILKLSDQQALDRYFDAACFAPGVRCPLLISCGLLDPVSPPESVIQIQRGLARPHEVVWLPDTHHDISIAFDRRAWRWLERQAGLPAPVSPR